METTGKQFSIERVRTAVRAHGLQKQLAADLGMSDSELSKFLDLQLPKFNRLLDVLGLELVERGEIEDLQRVLNRALKQILDKKNPASSVR